MAYDIPSFFVKPPSAGVRKDLPRYAIPEDAASELLNILKRDGHIIVRPGYIPLGSTLSNRVTGLVNYMHSNGSQKLVSATSVGWFVWNPTTQAWNDISGSALSTGLDDFQCFRVFYKGGVSYLVGCNGYTNAPVKWDGTAGTYSAVGGSPGNPKCLGVLANRMLMANFNNAPLEIDVSEFNDFEAGWGSVQNVVLADTPGEIVEIREMGALVAQIYKSDAWYNCTAAPGNYPFTFNLKQAEVSGPMSAPSVVSSPVGHFILAKDFNIYKCDGASYTALGDQVRSVVANSISYERLQRSFGFYDKSRKEVWFFWCGNESYYLWPTKGLVIRMDGTVWPVSFNMDYIQATAGLQTLLETHATLGSLTQNLGTYTQPLGSYTARQSMHVLGDATGLVLQEQGNLDNGDDVNFLYNSGMQAPSPERKFVTVGEVDLYLKRASASQTIGAVLYYSDENTDDMDYKYVVLDLSNKGPHAFGTRVTSRFFMLSISGAATEEVKYEGALIMGVERGLR